MTRFEEELRAALMLRRALLLELASDCLWAAEMPDLYAHPASEVRRLDAVRRDASRVEALTAAIMTRVGLSWDALGAQYEVSR